MFHKFGMGILYLIPQLQFTVNILTSLYKRRIWLEMHYLPNHKKIKRNGPST